jgi:putative hemolysin
MGPALEMGRTFIRQEYQRSYSPLMLLWKGIGAFVASWPRYRTLFGAVSITNDYLAYSRQLIVRFFRDNAEGNPLAGMVKPRNPFRKDLLPAIRRGGTEIRQEDIEELSSWIAGIEGDGKGVPILLKQYLKLGGTVLSFNVDPQFGHALDGFIVVDLLATEPKILKRYMGARASETFIAYHLHRNSQRTAA